MGSALKFFLLAGEPSGDRLGAALMEGLRARYRHVEFQGIGGSEMRQAGLHSLFDMRELSVMGLAEVLPRYRALLRRKNQTVRAVLSANVDALITIDSPDFSFRVAKAVKAQRELRTIHYVAPSVWAWRQKRAHKMARYIDHVLALLPFEPPLMHAAGMGCDFVGHPVVAEPVPSESDCVRLRQELGVPAGPVLALLPGSRRSEVTRLMPVFAQVVDQLRQKRPDIAFILPAAAPVMDLVGTLCTQWSNPPIILDPTGYDPAAAALRKRTAFALADVALAASGTVSLELAAAKTPMVIAYDMNPLSWAIMSRMARIDTVTLVNLIYGAKIVPEFLGPSCQPQPIARALLSVLASPHRQADALAETMRALGQGGAAPGLRAADAVIAAMGDKARDAIVAT